MKIRLRNALGHIQTVRILKKHLPNYRKLNKTTYIRKELYAKLKKKARKSITKKYDTLKGRTELTQKKYIRYTFHMRRQPINSVEQIYIFLGKAITKYEQIKKLNKTYRAQRIGINIANAEKEYTSVLNKKTGRQNKKEKFDFISTGTYRRDKESTTVMFEELQQKMINYRGTEEYRSLLEEDSDRKVKDFYVIYTQE